MSNMPLRYNPNFETPEKDEDETIQGLLKTLNDIREKTYQDTGCPMRSVHVKSHGLLKGELRVLENLPAHLAQGLFATPKTYPLLMRLSATPGDMLPDSVSTPRGCAIKIIGIEGARLPGFENDTTQSILMVNGDPAFQVANAKAFLGNLKLLAASTDKMMGAKPVISGMMRVMEKTIEAVGGVSSKIKNMGGEPEHHILGETFFSQVPFLFGDYMAKFSVAPLAPELTALTGQKVDITKDPLALRHAIAEYFKNNGGEWELRVQLCTDIDKMPIENAHKIWPEEESPYIAVARITVPPQTSWSEARSVAMDDHMTFNPWNGLAAHRPLGSINRARQPAYPISANFRALRNGQPMTEPTSLDQIPD